MKIKIETKNGHVVDIDIGKIENNIKGSADNARPMLIEAAKLHISYENFSSIMKEVTNIAKKEMEYADKLRQDAPFSTTYSYYRFYHCGVPDPDLALMKLIQKRLHELDEKLENDHPIPTSTNFKY